MLDDRGGHPKVKTAGSKSTWPGAKEVYRFGTFESDLIQLADEPRPQGSERLLKPVVLRGDVVPGSLPPLSEIWEFAQTNLRKLPEEYHQLISPKTYPVRLSKRLQSMREHVVAEHSRDGHAPASLPETAQGDADNVTLPPSRG